MEFTLYVSLIKYLKICIFLFFFLLWKSFMVDPSMTKARRKCACLPPALDLVARACSFLFLF